MGWQGLGCEQGVTGGGAAVRLLQCYFFLDRGQNPSLLALPPGLQADFLCLAVICLCVYSLRQLSALWDGDGFLITSEPPIPECSWNSVSLSVTSLVVRKKTTEATVSPGA